MPEHLRVRSRKLVNRTRVTNACPTNAGWPRICKLRNCFYSTASTQLRDRLHYRRESRRCVPAARHSFPSWNKRHRFDPDINRWTLLAETKIPQEDRRRIDIGSYNRNVFPRAIIYTRISICISRLVRLNISTLLESLNVENRSRVYNHRFAVWLKRWSHGYYLVWLSNHAKPVIYCLHYIKICIYIYIYMYVILSA